MCTNSVFVGVGQCGNQILSSYLNTLIDENVVADFDSPLLGLDRKLRCVLIDSEPKVVNHVSSCTVLQRFLSEQSVISGHPGCAANWALGINADLLDSSIEAIRREAEKADLFQSVVMLHSLAGGTGSGFGCRVSQAVRDEFSIAELLNVCVLPSERGGENPLQYYNLALSLAHLNEFSDGLCLLNNDSVMQQLDAAACVDMASLNRVIAQQLRQLFCSSPTQPHSDEDQAHLFQASAANSLAGEMIRSIFPLHSLKLARVSSSHREICPDNEASQTKLVSDPAQLVSQKVKHLHRNLTCCVDSPLSHCISSIASSLNSDCRANQVFLSQTTEFSKKLEKWLKPATFNSESFVDFWIDRIAKKQNSIAQVHSRSSPPHFNLTVLFNSGCIARFLNRTLNKAKIKFEKSAYLHWYLKHHLTHKFFQDSFDTIQQIIDDYSYFTGFSDK